MFRRIFSFFKRDDIKKTLPIREKVEMPKPKEIKAETKIIRLKRFLQRRRGEKLQKQIKKGLHIAHPKHCIKPMKPFPVRTDFSISADLHIDRISGRLLDRKHERAEIGIINLNKV
jgi:hypothetical protein